MENKILLLASSILVFPLTWMLFRYLPQTMQGNRLFTAAMGIYWILILIPTLLITKGRLTTLVPILTGSITGQPAWLRLLPFLPTASVLFISFLPNVSRITLQQMITVTGIAFINGNLEEIYWRGLYLKEFANNFWIGFITSSLLFGAWHISLWTLNGVTYHGGFASLVGGALAMGILWSFVSRRMKSIRICIFAHILVNILAFTGLFVQNS